MYFRENRLGSGNGQSEIDGSESLETNLESVTFIMK